MRRKLTLIIMVTLTVGAVLSAGPVAQSFEKQTPSRIPEGQFIPVPFEDFEKSGTYCLIQNDLNNPAFYFDEFDSGRSFAVYMDPGPCGQSPYPFKVTDAHFFIYDNPLGFSWPVDIQVNIVAANGGDKCLGPNPQRILCSESFTIIQDSSFANLGRPMNISLSSPCCVHEPFFLEVKYLDHMSEGDSLPSLLMDASVPPPDTCDNWVMYEGYYYEWSEFWSPPIAGDAILRATGYAGDEECVDLWYWKPDKPDQDSPAPSGMPDFDQFQDQWVAYCGPVAVANCLWWFDAVPPGWSPPQLIDTLARYFQTNPQQGGTDVFLMQEGLQQYFSDYGFALEETTFEVPDFFEMEDSLKKCQDIILLLGFWFYDEQGEMWSREGGHYVTMAGVCSESLKIAVSDPARDAAETGWPGRVRPGGHPPHPGDPILHNDALFVSHDIFNSILQPPFPSPGNPFWEIDYLWARGQFSGMNVPEKFKDVTRPAPEDGKLIPVTEVEFAVMICPTPTAVGEEEGESVPEGFELLQNYPNPFNNETVIKFSLEKPAQVSLVIYNILGRRVRTLVDETLQAGPQKVRWDGKDEKGIDLSSGIYFYQLKVGDSKQTRRLVLLK